MSKEIVGESLLLQEVMPHNLEQYLYVKKRASFFSKVYEQIEDVWSAMEAELRQSAFQEGLRMLIYDKKTMILYGYVETEMDKDDSVGISIWVLEEYRNRGIATKAAKDFIKYVLEVQDIDFVTWNAFLSNKASCRVAEKIGGIKKRRGSTVIEAMERVGFSTEKLKEDELLQEVCYSIFRKIEHKDVEKVIVENNTRR